jgi:hypothetical protein
LIVRVSGHKIEVRKLLVFATVCLALLMAMGFASREWRPNPLQRGVSAYDVHLKYYEEIRPSLVAGSRPVTALCNGERARTVSSVE